MSSRSNPHIIYGDFEWDADKAEYNLAEHEISFEEATTIFDDPFFIIYKDPDHSVGEQRYIIIGESEASRYLIVAFTERGSRTRIISARELDPKERRAYEKKKERF
ncbi:MAG TPA: BrnT family toxin [Pyrinomonadaceae bacterium]|nr:BrnT family toxin [Pyrinomonadaceae bacterium]